MPTTGPQQVARANSLALDARAKRKQQSEDTAARRRNLATDPISNLDKKQQERRAAVKGKTDPQTVARMSALADDARDKRKQAKRTMLEFDQRPRVPKRMAAEQGGRPDKPAPPSRVPEAPAPVPTKKAKYAPIAAPAPKRSGRAGAGTGRSSGRAPKLFAVTDVS